MRTKEEFETALNSCPEKKMCKGWHGGKGSLYCYYLCSFMDVPSIRELKDSKERVQLLVFQRERSIRELKDLKKRVQLLGLQRENYNLVA